MPTQRAPQEIAGFIFDVDGCVVRGERAIVPGQAAVAGDQLEQDIRMGKEIGLFTILVLTGVGIRAAAAAAPEALRPDLILPDLSCLPAWLGGCL